MIWREETVDLAMLCDGCDILNKKKGDEAYELGIKKRNGLF